MNNLIHLILLISLFELIHTAITPFCGKKLIRKADFIIHKVGTSLALMSFFGDCCWGGMEIISAVAVYWAAWANRYYLKAIVVSVWKTFGEDIVNQMRNIQKVKKTENTENTNKNGTETTPATETESVDATELFTAGPVEDADI